MLLFLSYVRHSVITKTLHIIYVVVFSDVAKNIITGLVYLMDQSIEMGIGD